MFGITIFLALAISYIYFGFEPTVILALFLLCTIEVQKD